MKKMLAFIMLALIALSACEKVERNVTINPEDEVTTESFKEYDTAEIERSLKTTEHLVGYSGASANGAFCDSGDVCYFVSQAYSHSLIVAYDKETRTSAPLCKRENCSHDEKDCSANIGAVCSGLAYHEGKLYWAEADTSSNTDLGMVVYCEDIDSMVRTVIKTVISGNASGVIDALFNGDKLIYSNAVYGGTEGRIHTVFGIADINGEDDIIILDDEKNEILELSFPANIDVQLFDDIIYYTVTVTSDRTDADSDVVVSVYAYDLKSGEFSKVCKLLSENGDIPKASGFKLLSENELYFMASEEHKVCRYDILAGSWEALYDFSEYGNTYGIVDGQIRNYVFVGDMCCIAAVNNGKTIIAAKDMGGKLVFEADVSEFAESTNSRSPVWISGGDDENVYCCFSFQDIEYTYQLDKTVAVPIGGGSAKLMYQNRSNLKKNWGK